MPTLVLVVLLCPYSNADEALSPHRYPIPSHSCCECECPQMLFSLVSVHLRIGLVVQPSSCLVRLRGQSRAYCRIRGSTTCAFLELCGKGSNPSCHLAHPRALLVDVVLVARPRPRPRAPPTQTSPNRPSITTSKAHPPNLFRTLLTHLHAHHTTNFITGPGLCLFAFCRLCKV